MTTSDLPIPRMADIIARALDYRASAERLKDMLLIDRIDRLINDKLPTARLCWELGTLLVSSPSGHTYHVSRSGCDCINAQRSGKRACWHLLIHELLLDLFETEAETADMQAEQQRIIAPRIVAARSLVWTRL